MDRRLDEVARDAVWSPLGMTATRYGPVPAELVERSAPTEFDDEAGAHVRGSVHDFSGRLLGVCGISGTFSTAPDLGRFLQHLVNPEAADVGAAGFGGVGFGRGWIRESLRLHTGDLDPARGLFWVPSPKTAAGEEDVWLHYGFTGTGMWVSPTLQRWAVLLTNKVFYSRDRGPIAQVRNEFRRLVFNGS